MTTEQLKELLAAVAEQRVSIEQAVGRLRAMPFEQLPFATVDQHRAVRCGHPEVIFGQGKSVEEVVGCVGGVEEVGEEGGAGKGDLWGGGGGGASVVEPCGGVAGVLRDCGGGGDGGGAAERGGRTGGVSGVRGADERGVWGEFWGVGGAA